MVVGGSSRFGGGFMTQQFAREVQRIQINRFYCTVQHEERQIEPRSFYTVGVSPSQHADVRDGEVMMMTLMCCLLQ